MERKAIFLDRDGVVCEEKNLFYRGSPITQVHNFTWIPGSKEALKLLAGSKFSIFIITNQSAIGKGLLDVTGLEKINSFIIKEAKNVGLDIGGIYFCPHLSSEKCMCRKPEIGLIEKAIKEHNLSREGSYFIGDSTTDIESGRRAGLKTILVKTGYGGTDNLYKVKPDFIKEDLLESIKFILNSNMKAIILAGGFGTRLREVVSDVPKPMALIAGKPFLEHQINHLRDQGITDIILSVHYKADIIKAYFGDGRIWNVKISYSEEDSPRGTAGAIKHAEQFLDGPFLVLNGDTHSPVDIKRLIERHLEWGSQATMLLAQNEELIYGGGVHLEGNKILGFKEKGLEGRGLINRGVYLFEPCILKYIEIDKKVSLEEHLFPLLIQKGLLMGLEDPAHFIDIGRPETYHTFKHYMLRRLMFREYQSIQEIWEKLSERRIEVALIVDREDKLLGVLNDRFIKNFLLRGGSLSEPAIKAMIRDPIVGKIDDSEEKINQLLISGIHRLPILDSAGRVIDLKFRIEKSSQNSFKTIRGRAPLRISFSGGGTDVADFYEKFGGVIISSTINKYCYATIKKRADHQIFVYSDLNNAERGKYLGETSQLMFNQEFDIIKAIVQLVKPDFGFDLYIHNDVPPERGLGSSASFCSLLVTMLGKLIGEDYSVEKIVEMAYQIERSILNIKGGWQDQYAATIGGFNYMEFSKEHAIIHPLRMKEEVVEELSQRLLLCYVGKGHQSGKIHEDQSKNINSGEVLDKLIKTKDLAITIKNKLLTNNLEGMGELLNEAWKNKKAFSKTISDESIEKIYEYGLNNGAIGGKLLGAGGGGYILFYFPPEKRNLLKAALKKEGLEILEFRFESDGVKTWFATG